ncbi:unnamed protein product [Tilletia laevis]|uniref:Endonuclease/exonuclease/phosphatase domain-containing protein n=2 Tax=Tilletia TaxID=13289 RepID=A0A8T8TLG4_9BASI|nr:hypothetical protein A4X03_0g2788 [Tilletia caries]CAD6932422.1 unnamed protein product [Tilletia caries]CAD6936429.1 unnamed protein product [Tilletia caries]CAD6964844.1 unnamed protein product [Tilletia laevis]
MSTNTAAAPPAGAPPDPPGSPPAAAPNIAPMDLADDGQDHHQARHQHKRPRTSLSGVSDNDEELAGQQPPAAATAGRRPRAAGRSSRATATATTTAPATGEQSSSQPPPPADRTLAASLHTPGSCSPLVSAARTAAAAEKCLQQAASRATAAGNAKARLFSGLLQSLKEAEALGAIKADAARLFRAAAIAATRTDAAVSVDSAELDRLATSLETWLTGAWTPPPKPATSPPAPRSEALETRPGTTVDLSPAAFPPLQSRAQGAQSGSSTRLDPPRVPAALKGMVVAGGGKNSAYNIARQGGRKDDRVFLRLPEKSKERELSERTLWLKLNEALKAAKASEHIRVMQVKKTNGGLALTPGPGCKTDELFGQKGTLEKAVDATGSALHEQFDKYVIAKVPTRDGEDEITMDEVRKNLEWTLGLKLVEEPRRLGKAETVMGAENSPVIFSLAPNALASRRQAVTHVHILGNRYLVRPYAEERRPDGCPRCLDYMGKHSVSDCPGPVRRRARAVVYYKGASLDRIRQEQSASRAALERASKKKRVAAQRAAAGQPDTDGFVSVRTRSSVRRLQEQQQQQQPNGAASTPATAASASSDMATTTGTAGGASAQANVGRSGPRTDAILRRADEERIDIILVQEPGGYWAPGKECPRTSTTYQALLPHEGSGQRPRVVTYVRKHGLPWHAALRQDILPSPSNDVLVLTLTAPDGRELWLIDVYSAPLSVRDGPGAGAELVRRLPLLNKVCLLAGDFNLHHEDWAVESWAEQPTESATAFADWARDNDWYYCLPAGTITRVATNRREQDSALDLVLASSPLQARGWVSECEVRSDWSVGSDHLPILTTIGIGANHFPPRPAAFSFRRADWERCRVLVSHSLADLNEAMRAAEASDDENARAQQLDDAAELFQGIIQHAMSETIPRREATKWGFPYWNPSCADAQRKLADALARRNERRRLGLRAVRENREVKRANKQLAKEVFVARRNYHRERLDSLQGPDIYAAAKWALGRRSYPSPPLSDAAGRLVVDAEEKRKLLRDTLIPSLPTPPRPTILDEDSRPSALPHEPVTWLEVRSAVFDPSTKKAAGPDEIGFAALRALWPVVNGFLHRLVCLSLAVGHMPASFKASTLVALRKPGRRDPSKPRSYRLISLQQCLGKVLERVLARRLTYIASVLNLVPTEQYGAIPGKSAVDAAVALHHDVECAWNQASQRTLAMLNSTSREHTTRCCPSSWCFASMLSDYLTP